MMENIVPIDCFILSEISEKMKARVWLYNL